MKETKQQFRIKNIEVEEKKSCYKITVEWFSKDPQLGQLGEYSRAVYVPDKKALEEFEEQESEKSMSELWKFEPRDDGTSEMIRKIPSSFDLGLQKFVDIRGADKIKEVSYQNYKYTEYISKCMIVKACIQQLHEMKDQIENGFCKWGDYPNQAGAFRSGEPYHDFIGAIETIDRFWA